MSNKHALLGPSKAEKWMNCPGSVVLEPKVASSSSAYADEGTAAHFLLSECINKNEPPVVNAREFIEVINGEASWTNKKLEDTGNRRTFTVDMEMVDNITRTFNVIQEYAAGGAAVIDSEQRLPLTTWTGEEDAFGTADVVILVGDELQVHDLKYGRGVVVEAEKNKQLMLYALAAWEVYQMFGEIKTVRLVIHQPRLNHHPEWVLTIEELLEFGELVKIKAAVALSLVQDFEVANLDLYLEAGEHCIDNFCNARATCPALQKYALTVTEEASVAAEGRMDNKRLSEIAAKIPVARGYFDAVEALVTSKVLDGEKVPGFKAVYGRQGNRKWNDEARAAAALQLAGLSVREIYKQQLISPADVDKLKMPKVSMSEVEGYITREAAKLTVVPESDKRTAVEVSPSSDFDNLEK